MIPEVVKEAARRTLPFAVQARLLDAVDVRRTTRRTPGLDRALRSVAGGYLVRVHGSLASQVAQYALAHHLHAEGFPVALDVSSFRRFPRFTCRVGEWSTLPIIDVDGVERLAVPAACADRWRRALTRGPALVAVFEAELESAGRLPTPGPRGVVVLDGTWATAPAPAAAQAAIAREWLARVAPSEPVMRGIAGGAVAVLVRRRESASPAERRAGGPWPADRPAEAYAHELAAVAGERSGRRTVVLADDIGWATTLGFVPAGAAFVEVSWESPADVCAVSHAPCIVPCAHPIARWIATLQAAR